MAVAPVDVFFIGFPGNKFSGQIAPAILELVDSGTIRVIDALFVSKNSDGVVTTLEARISMPRPARLSRRSPSHSRVHWGRRMPRRSVTTCRRTPRHF